MKNMKRFIHRQTEIKTLCGFSGQANYTDRATTAAGKSIADF
jgi:hypothetical protein